MRPDPFGPGTKLVQATKQCVYTGLGRSALDQFFYPYQTGSFVEVIQFGTVPFQGGPQIVWTKHNLGEPSQGGSNPNGTELLRSQVNAV